MKQGRLIILSAVLLSLYAAPLTPVSAAQTTGSLIKGTSYRSVYYFGPDAKRYVFPTEKIYRSWYQDFSGVVTIPDAELGSIPIGGNVTYRPGVKLVKVTTDPRVYAVGPNGTLRWVASEDAAVALYGPDWARNVDDVPDAFFTNYQIGEPIYSAASFAPETIRAAATDIATDKRLMVTPPPPPPATPPPSTATSTVPTSTNPEELSISNVVVTPRLDSVRFEWDTSAPTTGKVFYSVANGQTQLANSISGLSSHQIVEVGGLSSSTMYQFSIEGVDAQGRGVHRTGQIQTLTPPPQATLAFTGPLGLFWNPSSVTLSWQSANTHDCVASGEWSGSKPGSGSEVVITAPGEFILTCIDPYGQSIRASARTNTGATVTFSVNNATSTYTAHPGDMLTLRWSVQGAQCDRNGTGEDQYGPVYSTLDLGLSCYNNSLTPSHILKSVHVEVLP